VDINWPFNSCSSRAGNLLLVEECQSRHQDEDHKVDPIRRSEYLGNLQVPPWKELLAAAGGQHCQR